MACPWSGVVVSSRVVIVAVVVVEEVVVAVVAEAVVVCPQVIQELWHTYSFWSCDQRGNYIHGRCYCCCGCCCCCCSSWWWCWWWRWWLALHKLRSAQTPSLRVARDPGVQMLVVAGRNLVAYNTRLIPSMTGSRPVLLNVY